MPSAVPTDEDVIMVDQTRVQLVLRLFEARRRFEIKECEHIDGSGTTSDGLQLIKSEFGVGHGFE